MRKWLLVLAAVVGLGAAFVVWFAAEDARQAAFLDARSRDADSRTAQALRRERQLIRDGAPEKELVRAHLETLEAWKEEGRLRAEQWRRQQSWHARLRAEVRGRLGW